jgi:hypothetical protein
MKNSIHLSYEDAQHPLVGQHIQNHLFGDGTSVLSDNPGDPPSGKVAPHRPMVPEPPAAPAVDKTHAASKWTGAPTQQGQSGSLRDQYVNNPDARAQSPSPSVPTTPNLHTNLIDDAGSSFSDAYHTLDHAVARGLDDLGDILGQ